MRMSARIKWAAGFLALFPFSALAQASLPVGRNVGQNAGQIGKTPGTFSELVGLLISIINLLIPIVIGAALIVFFWGIVRYIASVDEDAKEKGRELAVWGSLAFFIMISVFGIIKILAVTFGVTLR